MTGTLPFPCSDYWNHWYDNNLQYRGRLYPFCETFFDVAASEKPTFIGAGFPLSVDFRLPFIDVSYSSLYVSPASIYGSSHYMSEASASM